MSNDADQKAILAALHRQANEILKLPKGEREAYFALSREAFAESAAELNLDPAKAAEFAGKMEEWLRGLVEMIESSGGGSGGRA
jgi:hypothetical protein